MPQSLPEPPILDTHRWASPAGPVLVHDARALSRTPQSTGLGRLRASGDELPLVAFIRALLNPSIVVLTLGASIALHGEVITGYYLLAAVLAFFLSAQLLDDVDLFRSWRRPHLGTEGRRILLGWLSVVGALALLGYATQLSGELSDDVLWTWVAATPVMLVAGQGLARLLVNRLGASQEIARKIVIIGANQPGLDLAHKMREDSALCLDVQGFFDDRSPDRLADVSSERLLGPLKDVPEYVRRHSVNRIYISLPMVAAPRIRALMTELRDTTASIYFVPDIFVFDLIQARFDAVNGIPVVAICESPFQGVNGVLKRISDVALSILILSLIWPLMLAVALAVKLSSSGPIIFRQRRYGLNGEEIVVYKFRSMTVCEDGAGLRQASRGDQRVTRVGAFLRATSLDELPQFINVLQGSMSIVGPRPHAVAHNEQYRRLIDGYMIRHKVKPGITGWAQVCGLRGETETVEKMRARVEHDLDYLRHWSLGLDLWIIVKTVLLVVKDKHAY